MFAYHISSHQETNVQDVEVARGLQIMFRAIGSKIEVFHDADTKEGLIILCGLAAYDLFHILCYKAAELRLPENTLRQDLSPIREESPPSMNITSGPE